MRLRSEDRCQRTEDRDNAARCQTLLSPKLTAYPLLQQTRKNQRQTRTFCPLSSVLCLLKEERKLSIAKRLRRSAPTACTHTVSGSISLPSPGFFSPFPHGTGSLSVSQEYLALEDGPPIFSQDNTCPDLLLASSVPHIGFRVRGYHPLSPHFPERSTNQCAITCRLIPVRSPLLRESQLISLPKGT